MVDKEFIKNVTWEHYLKTGEPIQVKQMRTNEFGFSGYVLKKYFGNSRGLYDELGLVLGNGKKKVYSYDDIVDICEEVMKTYDLETFPSIEAILGSNLISETVIKRAGGIKYIKKLYYMRKHGYKLGKYDPKTGKVTKISMRDKAFGSSEYAEKQKVETLDIVGRIDVSKYKNCKRCCHEL